MDCSGPPRKVSTRPFYQVAHVWLSVAQLWFVEQKLRALALTSSVVIFSILHTLVLVKVSYAQRDFSTSLAEKQPDDFYDAIFRFFCIVLVAAPLFAVHIYLEERLIIEWRTYLTRTLLDKYFRNRAYFRLQLLGTLDNPDQRICDDVATFTRGSTILVLGLLQNVFNMLAFVGVMWTVSPRLVVFIIVYAVGGTFVTAYLFGRRLMTLTYRSLQREGDLRFALVRTRENAESIAFFQGGPSEAAECKRRLRSLYWALLCKNVWYNLLQLFTNYYRYATILVPPLTLCPAYFAGEIQFGTISQATYAFDRIETALSTIVSRFSDISGLAAETERLAVLLDALDRGGERSPNRSSFIADESPVSSASGGGVLDTGRTTQRRGGDEEDTPGLRRRDVDPPDSPESITTNPMAKLVPVEAIVRLENPELTREAFASGALPEMAAVLTVTGLTLRVPRGTQLICRDLDLTLSRGMRLLIVGPSGAGKSSLLRAIAGLWTEGAGTVNVPPVSEVFFVPQKPFMNAGALRAQLLFPRADPATSSAAAHSEIALAREVSMTLPASPSLAARLGDLLGVPIFARGPDARPLIPADPLADADAAAAPDYGPDRPLPSDEELRSMLRTCGLASLARLHHLDEERDWGQVLSVGEQQRVAMCRLLVSAPLLAFLDEGTSALDTETEARLYRLLRDRCGSFVSVGHRMQLVQYHSHVLEARGEGRWRLVTAEQFEAEAEARGGLGSAKAQGGSPAKFKQAQAQHF